MHGMRTPLWKQVKEPGVTRCWNSSDGVGDPKIWWEWPAWSLSAVDRREFSQVHPGHYRYLQGRTLEMAPALLVEHGVEDQCPHMDKGLGSAAREFCCQPIPGQLRLSCFHPIVFSTGFPGASPMDQLMGGQCVEFIGVPPQIQGDDKEPWVREAGLAPVTEV